MRKRHKIFIFLIGFSVLFIVMLYGQNANAGNLQNIVTFCSIAFGFYVTSLATILTSSRGLEILDEIDSEKKNYCKKHILRDYYIFASVSVLLLIGLIIAYLEFSKIDNNTGQVSLIKNYVLTIHPQFDLNKLIVGLIFGTTATALYCSFLLFKFMVSLITSSTKSPTK